MATWSATASNLPSYGERVISSVKWKAVISEIYDYLHTVRTASYGTVEPTAENGELWYDTNVGQNKLKVKTATGWFGISFDLPIASTPTANNIPVADAAGKIDDGWIPATVARTESPTLTGTPTAPTAEVGSNSTMIATTAFVNAEIASDRPYATVAPVMDGTAAVGTSAKVALEDHKHPVDTSRAATSHTHAGTDVTSAVANATNATTAESCSGNAATATKLATARTISLTGDVTGSASFDGSDNVSIGVSLTGIPAISSGDSGKLLAVKSDESGAEWVTAPSGVSLGLVIALGGD